MAVKYGLKDFRSTPKEGTFYCPGCNASPDDYALLSRGCPCDEYSDSKGSLTEDQVIRYLAFQLVTKK